MTATTRRAPNVTRRKINRLMYREGHCHSMKQVHGYYRFQSGRNYVPRAQPICN